MFFNSQTFLYLFLPGVLLLYYGVGGLWARCRNAVLFGASVFFYTWGEKEFVLVLLGSLVVNYWLGRAIEREQLVAVERGGSGRRWLTVAVGVNLFLLVWLKYAGFLVGNVAELSVQLGGPTFRIPQQHLPIGLSFFTFQAISYCIDVARREVPAEKSALKFGLYVFLFPHLIAGPIVRYADLAAQLKDRPPRLEQFSAGIHRFIIGLAKKVLIADTLAVVVDGVFRLPNEELTTSVAWLAMVAYGLQIYFDFSGYSDMAIGLGKLFGFEFLENFDYPYSAQSLTEFWRRWHLSLSSWFRDYVYIPLGGNRGSALSTYRNLMIVFALCGIWHGASWAFLIWGLFHGSFLVLERLGWGRRLTRLPRGVRHSYTLCVVLVGWVFFRAHTLPQAGAMIAALFGFADGSFTAADFASPQALLALLAGAVASLPLVPWIARRTANAGPVVRGTVELGRVVGFAALLFASTTWLAGHTYSSFIYFRF